MNVFDLPSLPRESSASQLLVNHNGLAPASTPCPGGIDIARERLISIGAISDHLPRSKTGRKIHVSAAYRWMQRGLRGVRLEYLLDRRPAAHQHRGAAAILRPLDGDESNSSRLGGLAERHPRYNAHCGPPPQPGACGCRAASHALGRVAQRRKGGTSWRIKLPRCRLRHKVLVTPSLQVNRGVLQIRSVRRCGRTWHRRVRSW